MIIASIDLGSNTAFLKIINTKNNQILVDKPALTRPAEDFAKNKFIKASKIMLLYSTLKEYKSLLEKYNVDIAKGVATAVFRDAVNGKDVIDFLKNEFNIDLSIISGEEEAFLSFLGASVDFKENKTYSLIDIGGRSTEISIIKNNQITDSFSYGIGAVSLFEEFFNKKNKYDEAIKCVSDILNSKKFNTNFDFCVAIGGIPTTFGSINKETENYDDNKVHLLNLSLNYIQEKTKEFSFYSFDDFKKVKGLDIKRADIVVSGGVILSEILKYLNKNNVILSVKTIRDGILEQIKRDLK